MLEGTHVQSWILMYGLGVGRNARRCPKVAGPGTPKTPPNTHLGHFTIFQNGSSGQLASVNSIQLDDIPVAFCSLNKHWYAANAATQRSAEYYSFNILCKIDCKTVQKTGNNDIVSFSVSWNIIQILFDLISWNIVRILFDLALAQLVLYAKSKHAFQSHLRSL